MYDFAAATPAWSANKVVVSGAASFDSPITPSLTANNGVGIASGAVGSYTIYALDNLGVTARLLSDASRAGQIAAPSGVTAASKLMITQAASGNNVLYAVTLAGVGVPKIYTYTDKMAVAVTGATAALNPSDLTGSVSVTWAAVTKATTYQVIIRQGTTAAKDVYTAANSAGNGGAIVSNIDSAARTATFSNLIPNTQYTVSVWAVAPVTSFAGVATVLTQLSVPTWVHPSSSQISSQPVEVNPVFQWSVVPGATNYELWVATKADFSDAQKFTTVIPAYAWTGTPLANNTAYYTQVRATTTLPANISSWGYSVFTTEAEAEPPITVTTTTTPPPNITVTTNIPSVPTPGYIWIIIVIGAILTIAVIVLIVRTRRVV